MAEEKNWWSKIARFLAGVNAAMAVVLGIVSVAPKAPPEWSIFALLIGDLAMLWFYIATKERE